MDEPLVAWTVFVEVGTDEPGELTDDQTTSLLGWLDWWSGVITGTSEASTLLQWGFVVTIYHHDRTAAMQQAFALTGLLASEVGLPMNEIKVEVFSDDELGVKYPSSV